MTYERLTAADAAFLRLETAHEPQHVGSLSIIDGAPLRDSHGGIRFEELQNHIEGRLPRVPRLRQRILDVAFNQGRPVWVDDPGFDLNYHVRLTSLAAPGADHELVTLHARIQATPLDRSRPLWEMWFIDGLASGDVGFVMKTHHALGDGIANVDLALALLDLEPDVEDDAPVSSWRPRPAPSTQKLLADSVWDQITRPARLASMTAKAFLSPRKTINAAAGIVRTTSEFLRPSDPAPWNKAVTGQRRWAWVDVPRATVDRVRAHQRVSVNDVVLTAAAGALRTFLAQHGDSHCDREALKAMVPVSLRTEDEHGATLGNHISMLLVDLPTGIADPLARLHAVNKETQTLKTSNMVGSAQTILEIADAFTPFAGPLTRFVSRRVPMNLVVTNVPGPPVPLYLAGAKVLRTYPYVEVIDDQALTIAVVSYCEQLHFGITSDHDVLPELDELAVRIGEAFDELAVAAEAAAES